MVTKTSAEPAAKSAVVDEKTATSPPPAEQDAMVIEDLAKGVLARDFRPRAGSIRRLAEAVLAPPASPAKPRKKKKKKKKAATEKGSGKKRKLARIPGQKARK